MTTPAPNLALTVTLDKAVYKRGDQITATLDLTELDTLTVNGSATDANSNTATGQATASIVGPPEGPVSFGVSDSAGTSYTQESADGGTAVVTGTIPAAPAA